MPCTCEATVRCENAILQRGSVMSAIRAHGVSLVTLLDQENLAILNAFNLDFTLFTILQIKA